LIATLIAAFVLGGLIGWFAYSAEKWRGRAEFWQDAYYESAAQVAELVEESERYLREVDSAVIRVWASQN
jgi:hypothetical protein